MKKFIPIQLIVILYTIGGIIAKYSGDAEFLSLRFFFMYGMEIFVLGVYALCWQQIIKRFPLSVAYANRAMSILWAALWSVLLFKEMLTLKQLFGIILILMGTLVVNLEYMERKE